MGRSDHHRVLVTGGAGFLGGHYTHFLRHNLPESSVVVLDKLTYAACPEHLADLEESSAYRFIHGDVCDTALVKSLIDEYRIGTIVHFAAESHVDRAILDPRQAIRANIEGTSSMLEAARAVWDATEREENRFVHISTDEVLGPVLPDGAPLAEDAPLRPTNPYSSTKAAAEHLVRAWHLSYGLSTLIVRSTNIYGAWQYPEKLIPLTILNALDGQPLPIYGDGRQTRDWLHIDDYCRALNLISERGTPGSIYHVAGLNERTNLQTVRHICDLVDAEFQNAEDHSRSLIRFVRDRPGHDRRYALDVTWTERQLGWRPERTMEDALQQVVRWYIANRGWAGRVRDDQYFDYVRRQYGDPASGNPIY